MCAGASENSSEAHALELPCRPPGGAVMHISCLKVASVGPACMRSVVRKDIQAVRSMVHLIRGVLHAGDAPKTERQDLDWHAMHA